MQKRQRVLIVDDEASVRRQLSVGLLQSGFEVEDCEDGLSALHKIETARRNQTPYNYIITDIRLPDIIGLKLLQVIKSKYPDLPVVVISGYGDEQTREDVKEFFGNAYLDKPFEVEELEATLKRIGPPEDKATGLKPKTAAEEGRLASAYVFIRGKNDADLYDAFSKLYFADGVLYCDAVRGEAGSEWDIVLLLQAADVPSIQHLVKGQIQSLGGVQAVEIHHSERPGLGEDLESFIQNYERMNAMEKVDENLTDKRNRRSMSAYAILEIDRSYLIPLYSKLYFTDHIVYCDSTDQGKMMILFLQAPTFEQIRKTITNEIRTQPGVLRVKVLNIVQVMEM
jgi:CheY-like chemotaxis protein